MRIFEKKKEGEEADSGDVDVAKVENALKSAGIDDKFPFAGGIAPAGLRQIKYTTERFGKWQIDHGRDGDDYVIQMIPTRAIKADMKQLLATMFEVMANFIPRTIDIYYNVPNERLAINFYTIRVAQVYKTPGAKDVLSKIPAGLGEINAWI